MQEALGKKVRKKGSKEQRQKVRKKSGKELVKY